MPHAIWKGAISFGLVHVPVALYPASTEIGIDFDWLDRRSMAPVGYKRINKKTGREVPKQDIVKGVRVDDGAYVVLGEDEIKAAYPLTTQTIAIESFAHAAEIAFTHLERPYFLEPIAKGEKAYALLREAMREAGVIGIARVVMHTKEYLAALIPDGPALMLNTLRWADELRPREGIRLPSAGKGSLQAGELKMARQLIAGMTTTWKPDAYADRFTRAIHALVAKRAAAGATEQVAPMEEGAAEEAAGNVVDLTRLLRQSLSQHAPRATARAAPARARTKRTPVKTAKTAKTASKPRPVARKRA